MFRFDCTFSNFNCTKRVQLHTILRPAGPIHAQYTIDRFINSTVFADMVTIKAGRKGRVISLKILLSHSKICLRGWQTS